MTYFRDIIKCYINRDIVFDEILTIDGENENDRRVRFFIIYINEHSV